MHKSRKNVLYYTRFQLFAGYFEISWVEIYWMKDGEF